MISIVFEKHSEERIRGVDHAHPRVVLPGTPEVAHGDGDSAPRIGENDGQCVRFRADVDADPLVAPDG